MKPSRRTTEWVRLSALILAVLLIDPSLAAQSVQLPSVRQFSYRGGVLVPDRGTATLGGNRSSARGAASHGLPLLPNLPRRSSGSQSSAGGVSATVTIIDLDEMDRQILGYDPHDFAKNQRRGGDRKGVARKSVVEEIAEAKSLVRNARQAWRSGQRTTAKHTYELAIERLSRLAKTSPGGDEAKRYPSRQSDGPLAQQPAYLLAWARAEYARIFPGADAASRVRP